MTLQSFYRSIMTVEYQIHIRDYIANCINKDVPQLHCNGQCVLMKKIREKEKGEAKKNLLVYEYSTNYVYHEFPNFEMHIPKNEILKNPFSSYLMEYTFTHHSPVFRPPIV